MRLRRQTILLIVLVTARTTEGRVNSRAKQYPACYTDSSQWTTDLYDDCKHPASPLLRITFVVDLIITAAMAITRAAEETHGLCNYEIVGMVTGILSWVCLLAVLGICVGPRGVHTVYKLLKRNRKNSPLQDEAEMKAYYIKH